MDKASQIASDVTVFAKYAKYLEKEGRRENWDEIVNRYQAMLIKKVNGKLPDHTIIEACNLIREKKVLPSMRCLQFAGGPIERNNARNYNCLGVETEFVTSEGVRTFADFMGGERISVLTHKGRFKNAVVKRYGNQKLYNVRFTRDKATKVVRATSNHRWLLADGSVTTSLAVGDKVFPIAQEAPFSYEDANPLERLYWCYGYVFGDGTRVSSGGGEPKYSMVRLCGKDTEKYKSRFEEVGFSTSSPLSCKGDFIAYTGKYLKTLPVIGEDSIEMLKAFVDGYLCADGSKNSNHLIRPSAVKYNSIQTASEEAFEFLMSALPLCGYFVSRVDNLDGKTTNYGTRGFTRRIGIINNFTKLQWTVSSITESADEDVWCLEVEDDHSFVLPSGIVTGNCAYHPADREEFFKETMFLLLGGTGVGYSVQKHHVDKLPTIKKPKKPKKWLVGDSIEGWADAVGGLMKAYFRGNNLPVFDYSDIRPKGARLITAGGKAPGPAPLRVCLDKILGLLEAKPEGSKLEPWEVSDIACYIADAVLSGGIRRSAMICLFDSDDEKMLHYKSGAWWELNPERGRANISAVAFRSKTTKADFDRMWEATRLSNAGEPGIFWTNDPDWGTNPCSEIALRPRQMCNLTTINYSTVVDADDFMARVRAATILGTIQASFTDFHYLSPEWRETCEREALLGVSMTGLADNPTLKLDLASFATYAKAVNEEIAGKLGINCSARITTIKPEGTASLVLGTSSGVHARHAKYYIRRFRFKKNEALAWYLMDKFPKLVVDDKMSADAVILELPQKSPDGSIIRGEHPVDLLERVKSLHTNWIKGGHVSGYNTHNVSCTVSIKDDEWDAVGLWMWVNRDSYTGLSVLPFDGGSYVQAPFEECSEEEYERRMKDVGDFDISLVTENEDETEVGDTVACAGGACLV